MFSQFFGNYLLGKNLLTTEQLKDALSYQRKVHVKLGVLAIDAKLMTPDQVDKVHNLQTRVDKRFGELAVLQGYLTAGQLEELLSKQNKGHLLLSQALIDRGYFTYEQVEKTLEAYKHDTGFSDEYFEALKNEDIDAVVPFLLRVDEEDNADIFCDSFLLFLKNVIRFIDPEVRFDVAEKIHSYEFKWLAYQLKTGKYDLFTGFSGDEPSMAAFAGRFAGEQLNCMDELASDAVGEFMNYYCGLLLSKLSNDNLDLEILPQVVVQDKKLHTSGNLYKVPFYLPFGKYDFLVCEGHPQIDEK